MFKEIKQCLTSPPILAKPKPGETLVLYLSVGKNAISVALVKESEGGQDLIYFVSRALQDPELRYQKLEKVSFTLLITARRLRLYFQGHPIIVRTNQPIRHVLHKPYLARQMKNWEIEFSELDVSYESRQVIQSQALVDFVMELTPAQEKEEGGKEEWKIFIDGSSNVKGSGVEVIIGSPEGVAIEHSINLGFPTSNNQAEYEALIAGLEQAKELGAKRIRVFSESQLVTSQIEGKYQAKGTLMAKYLSKVKEMLAEFEEATIIHILRNENSKANILSKLASTKNPGNHRTVVQETIPESSCVMLIMDEDDWRRPIFTYLEKGTLPDDSGEARSLIHDGAMYTIVVNQL